MTIRDRLATPLGRGVVLGVLAFAVYLLTRTRDFGGDDTVFALTVDRFLAGLGASRELWHPHHPLFNPLVTAVAWLARALGLTVLTLDVGAAVSAAFAAVAVGALAALLTAAALPAAVVWSSSLAALACGGLWGIATSMEVYAMGAAAVVAWLAAASRERPSGWLVGAGLAAAILSHLVLGLLVVPTLVILRRWPRELARALLLGLGGSGLAMALILALAHGALTPSAMLAAVLGEGNASFLSRPSPPSAVQALERLVAWNWFASVNLFGPAAASLLRTTGTVLAGVLGMLALLGVTLAWRDQAPLGRVATGGVLTMLPLWLVWDVGNVEHVVAATPLLATLVALGAARLAGTWGARLAVGVCAALLGVNGLGSAVPHSRLELSRNLLIATFVASSVPADGVVASVGRDARLRLSLPYLSGRRVVDLTMLVVGAGGRGLPPAAGLLAWQQELARGGRVYLMPDVVDPASVAVVTGLGLTEVQWRAALGSIQTGEVATLPADGTVLEAPFSLTRARVLSLPAPPR